MAVKKSKKPKKQKKIYIASDHAGFKLKERIKAYLLKKGFNVGDFGPFKYEKTDDYPDYAAKLSKKIQKTTSKGILVCGTSQGMCITANKFKGIIAAPAWNLETAKHAKTHDNADILCLGAGFVKENQAKKMIMAWLNSKFKKARHARRIRKIKRIERIERKK